MASLKVHGTVAVPGDKSISHRALILGALATGETRITGILDSADVRSTCHVLTGLGAEIPDLASEMILTGVGLKGLKRSQRSLDCGNSGTTTRLMAGVAAAYPFLSTFEGDASLSRRPMRRIADPLTSMGARFEFARGDGLPMTVTGGSLRPVDWNTGGSSAQVKSAILLAAVVAGVEVRVVEKALSRDHTERMLRAMGVDIVSVDNEVVARSASGLEAIPVEVPADPSSAAFFVALATLADRGELRIPDVCLNPTRTGFFRVLKTMGADISEVDVRSVGGEDIGTLVVRPAELGGASIDEHEIGSMIDELPLLACVAAAAQVELTVRGAGELRVKESDRINAVVENLRAVGATADESPDGLHVAPGSRTLAGTIDSRADHRIAMSFGVLGRLAGNNIEVRDRDCVNISFPKFWSELARVTE
ncbi:MAG TPA: 3-phosphoshikimate 1-carboxyvinyltransferase [Gemmatimonadaceae bacterium]